MPKVKTIILDGTEIAVKFEKGYPYYAITNMGDGELYASGSPGITAYADGVYTILPGMETRISPELSADTVFLLGSGMVQVRAEEIAVPTSFNSSGKGGGSGGDYTLLDNKPSVEGVELNGNKTLADLGITNFDGQYASLINKPIISGVSKSNLPISTGWIRACSITNIPIASSFIIKIDRSSIYYRLQDAASTALVGILSYSFSHNKSHMSFKILNNVDRTNEITQIRFSVTTWGTNKTMHIDFYVDSNYGLDCSFDICANPTLWQDSTFEIPLTRYDRTIPSDFSVFTFQNKMDTVDIDSVLSETSTNPVQNAVITAALNGKLDSTDISDWAKADTKPSYTAEEVGADATGSASTALIAANSYTDVAITNLVGAAPDDLNTLEELAQAYKDNKDFAEILSAAITQKQNKLTKTVLYNTDSSPSPDWNELKEMSVRLVHIGNSLSDSYTHGLNGVYGYGVLSIFSDPSANANIVYQKYVTDVSNQVYMRSLYNNTWRNWKRIDAGAGVTGIKGEAETTYRNGNVNITKNDIDLYKVFAYGYFTGKTIGEFKTEILEYINQQEHSPWTVDFEGDVIGKWNDDTNIIGHGTNCKITPIGGYSDYQGGYIRCVLSTYTTTDSATYLFVVSAGQFSGLHRVITDEDITPEMIEKLKNL